MKQQEKKACLGCNAITRTDILDENAGYCDWCDDANKDVNKVYEDSEPKCPSCHLPKDCYEMCSDDFHRDDVQHSNPATVEEVAERLFPIQDDWTDRDRYIEYSKRHGFIRGYNYAQHQPEPSTALDETRDSLSELIRSLSQINNGTPGIAEYHVKRLNKAKQVLAKYADPNQPRIVQSEQPEPTIGIEAFLESEGWNAKDSGHFDYNGLKALLQRYTMQSERKPEPMGGKSLDECKDEVAKQFEYKNWIELLETAEADELNCFWEEVAELYASQQRVQEWISVEDRLPENEERVLCLHIDSGNMFLCYRTKDCHTQEPIWHGGAMPTHWMPLPDKPERP